MVRYADPTRHEAAAQARDLVQRLEPMLPVSDGDSRVSAIDRALHLAVAAGRDVAAWTEMGSVGWEEFDRALQLSEWLREISDRLSGEDVAADALVAWVCAVRRGTCSIGHCRPTSCSPAPQRALLAFNGETRQGCFQHIAEDLVRLHESRAARNYEIISPPGVVEAIEVLASSGAVTVTDDLETDFGQATAQMLQLELEYDLAQHSAQCAEAAIEMAHDLGHDDESTIRQAAAQVLEAQPNTCRCRTSAVD